MPWRSVVLFFFFSFLVVDGLSAILRNVELHWIIERFHMGRGDRIMVSHLADDTIIFLKADLENIRNMELCLNIFEVNVGIDVNIAKYCLVGINVGEGLVAIMVDIIGCKAGDDH